MYVRYIWSEDLNVRMPVPTSSKQRLLAACQYVYRDMPELRKIAIRFIEDNYNKVK